MNICMLVPDPAVDLHGHRAAAAHVRGLAAAFARLGHDVTLLSAAADGSASNGNGTSWSHDRVRLLRLPAPTVLTGLATGAERDVVHALGELWNNAGTEATLEEIVGAQPPDLLYERAGSLSIAAGVVARRHGIPHILEVNAPPTRMAAVGRRRSLLDAADVIEAATLRNAERIVTVSRQLRDLLVSSGADAAKVRVVPNGVDTELFHARSRGRAARKGPITIAYAGSLEPWHGIGALCDAMRLLSGDDRFRLLVIGEGSELEAVRELASELPGRVAAPGALPHEQVAACLRDADIAVAPYPEIANFYFSPLKVLEYMALGLTVVASRIGQLQELIRDSHTGVLVQPGDATDLAREIRQLGAEPTRRNALGIAAAQHVAANHSWMHRAQVILQDLAMAA